MPGMVFASAYSGSECKKCIQGRSKVYLD